MHRKGVPPLQNSLDSEHQQFGEKEEEGHNKQDRILKDCKIEGQHRTSKKSEGCNSKRFSRSSPGSRGIAAISKAPEKQPCRATPVSMAP